MKLVKIENKTGRVKLDDTVDEWSRRQLAEEMKRCFGADALANPEFAALTASAESDQIDCLEIEVNSPGGSVMDGMLIYNELKALRARGVRVVAIVNVLAASMGSVICMAADEVQIVKNGRMMIHDASLCACGTAKDFERFANLLESISNEIAGIYAEKTGKTCEEMRGMMLAETWLDSKACIEVGLADSIFDFGNKTSNLQSMSVLARLTNPSAPEAIEQITGLQARVSELEADLTAAATELQTIQAQLTERDELLATQAAAIADISGQLTEANRIKAEHEAAIATHVEAIAAAQASAAQQAAEIAASAGIEKPLAIAGNGSAEVLTKTRAELDTMKPAAIAKFFKSGGKLTD